MSLEPAFDEKLTLSRHHDCPGGYRLVTKRTEDVMATEMLSYSQLGGRLTSSTPKLAADYKSG